MKLIDFANIGMFFLLLWVLYYYWKKEKEKEKARVKKFRFDNKELVDYVENKYRKE